MTLSTASWFDKIFKSSSSSREKHELNIFFSIDHEKVHVATMKYDGNYYVMEYDSSCPESYRIKDFSEDVVKFKTLPPFFSTRIPSEKRPEIREKMDALGTNDLMVILGNLGKKS